MGIFDRFKKEATASKQGAEPHEPALAGIARVISDGDETVLGGVAACMERPAGWFAEHQDRYQERGVDSAEDADLVQWLGLVDILEEHGWVCERDWKDELEDFSYFVQNLHGFQQLGLELDPDWLDEDEDIPTWCGILTEKWSAQGVRMAAIDIDSDSYVLFPTTAPQLAQLQKLAEEIGHHIVAVERM